MLGEFSDTLSECCQISVIAHKTSIARGALRQACEGIAAVTYTLSV